MVFVQYVFDGVEHTVNVLSHGNCKLAHASAYVRTKESTVNKPQQEASVQAPKAAYHTVHKEQGGIINASSLNDLPRNRAQAHYMRRGCATKRTFNQCDSLVVLLEQCKRQQIERDCS